MLRHPVGRQVHLVRVVVRREQVVDAEEVAHHVAGVHRAARHVVAHRLERRAVPRVEVHLAVALAELRRERRVVDQVLRGRQRGVVGGRLVLDEAHSRVAGELADGRRVLVDLLQRPHVPQVAQVAGREQAAEDRLGVAEHAVAGERLVEDGVLVDTAAPRARQPLVFGGKLDATAELTEPRTVRGHETPSRRGFRTISSNDRPPGTQPSLGRSAAAPKRAVRRGSPTAC